MAFVKIHCLIISLKTRQIQYSNLFSERERKKFLQKIIKYNFFLLQYERNSDFNKTNQPKGTQREATSS